MGGKKQKPAKPTAPAPSRSTFGSAVRGAIKAPAALAFLWPVLLVTGGYLAWHRWGADQINRRYNALNIEQVQISPPPDYIRSNVIESVFRATDLTKVSLMDLQATAQIANAFATSPWVESVRRVQKTSTGNVDVHVAYRRPVAMVKVVSRHPEVDGMSFFPVDGHSVLLPTDDFSRADTLNYIHIIVQRDTYPISGVGSKFGDTKVADAALLAMLLSPYRESLGIEAITITQRAPHDERPQLLNLVMKNGKQIVWGSAPGKELNNEPHASVKLQALLKDSNRSLNDLHVAQPLAADPARR
ncbi:Cell division protein FtsQ [Rosistilla carotiformis]|uniref:Cell division protein FtsQ n=1 Tax=Rosistilla carotiformis TaxID=2528017 RepID=A0A518JQ82_9BACT|nr:hypothetical protein [Rosistilla carotiformis]QDV67704.1 Cell division protein FtsQ [Rosistilla carotiformis]